MLDEKYEKMLKWNNVIKSLQYTIIIIHFFLKFYFFENASKTHKGPSCNRNAQKIFKAGKLLCSFLSIARLLKVYKMSQEVSNMLMLSLSQLHTVACFSYKTYFVEQTVNLKLFSFLMYPSPYPLCSKKVGLFCVVAVVHVF